MSSDHAERTTVLYECDHLRPVVQLTEGDWRHVIEQGRIGGRCGSVGYRIRVAVLEQHNVGNAVYPTSLSASLSPP